MDTATANDLALPVAPSSHESPSFLYDPIAQYVDLVLIVVLLFIIDSALQKICEYNDVGWKEISCTRDLERGVV